MNRPEDVIAHRESASVEYRAQSAIVNDVNRLTRQVRHYLDAPTLGAALGTIERRQARAPRAPDWTLVGSISDVVLAGSVMGRWHSVRWVLPTHHTFADSSRVRSATPSSWRPHALVQRGVDYLSAKDLMTPRAYAALRDGYRNAGFSIAGQTEVDLLEVAKRSVAGSLRRGYDSVRAGKSLNDALKRAGYDPLEPWHARLVAQMNYATAYGAGSWEQLHAPGMRGIIPAFRYVTMRDNRVRPEHARMEGKVFARNHPFWDTWWPPNGYNCRDRKSVV